MGTPHESHEGIRKRLQRAEGHLRSIITMIETERSCVDIAQQLHAVEKAVCQAKRTLIRDHVEHCLEHRDHHGSAAMPAALEELKQITKYL